MMRPKQKHSSAAQDALASRSTTPFPSALLDEVMPTLRDTEWRLLCVIVRQTLGWQEETGRRKNRDWLTHRQLKARTGRSSEAVCRAIETLVARDLIEVEDKEGRRLETPQERQHRQGQLFFRLAPRLAQWSTDKQGDQARESREDGVDRFPKTETPISESEITKAKTTKETGDKKRETHQTVIHSKLEDNSGSAAGSSLQELARIEEMRPRARQFLRSFQDKGWRMGRWTVPPPVVWARDEPLVIDLLVRFPYQRLDNLADRFFASRSEELYTRGYSLAAFAACLLAQLPGSGAETYHPGEPVSQRISSQS